MQPRANLVQTLANFSLMMRIALERQANHYVYGMRKITVLNEPKRKIDGSELEVFHWRSDAGGMVPCEGTLP